MSKTTVLNYAVVANVIWRANSLIPSRKQFAGWSLPSKVTYISFILALAGIALTIIIELEPWNRETKVVDYRPNVPSRELEGKCWTRAFTLVRADTWRCDAPGGIYDPCFQIPQQDYSEEQTVVCGASPFSPASEAFVLTLSEALPISDWPTDAPLLGINEGASAWILVLRNGYICRFASGASTQVLGNRLNYICRRPIENDSDDDETIFAIIGRPRSGDVWEAQMIEWGDSGVVDSEIVEISEVYR